MSRLILVLLAGMGIGFTFLVARAFGRWQGWWRWVIGAPAVWMVGVILNIIIAITLDPTAHNLWPLEILAWLALVSVVVGLLYLAHWLNQRPRSPRRTLMFATLSDRRQVAIFGMLTLLLTFATYLLPLPRTLLPFLMVLLPACMAIGLTALSKGGSGVRSLLGKLGQWRIRPKWLLIALLVALGIRLSMSVVALWLGLIPAIQVRPVSAGQLLLLALVFLLSAIPEELGWRGYALPRLLTHHSALTASLLIGAVWGSLHLALLLPGMMNEGALPLPTVLALVGGSVVFTWLYVNSGGSIVLTTIFHGAQSFFVVVNEGIAPGQQMWLLAGVYLAVALVILALTGWNLMRSYADDQTINHLLYPTMDDAPPG